jgi:ADP-ribose pyrophosphatase YjhB (NUDIX family)
MQDRILSLFLYEENLKFSEIAKQIKIRTNKLAYHLKSLVKKGIIEKNNNDYKLSENSEYLIPYLSNKNSVLPVIIIRIKENSKIFLVQREKRPYKNKLSLPGGRLLLGETISKATSRIMEDKFNIQARLTKTNSISIEHVRKDNKIIHSFLLIFVDAITEEKIRLFDIEKNKSKIIPSDYKLIKNPSTNIVIETINSKLS